MALATVGAVAPRSARALRVAAAWPLAQNGGRARLLSRSADIALTPREQVVLAALAEHDSIKAVAESLILSPHTVKSQLQGIYRKLGVSSRRSALDVARDLGLVETADPRG